MSWGWERPYICKQHIPLYTYIKMVFICLREFIKLESQINPHLSQYPAHFTGISANQAVYPAKHAG